MIDRDGGFALGASVAAVMTAYEAAAIDHIDVIAAV